MTLSLPAWKLRLRRELFICVRSKENIDG